MLAAGVCDAPVGFVTLTDNNRQAPAALHGLPRADTRYLICADAAMREASGALLVAYTASDPRVGGAHMLLNEPAIRSCAVVVLESAEGHAHRHAGRRGLPAEEHLRRSAARRSTAWRGTRRRSSSTR